MSFYSIKAGDYYGIFPRLIDRIASAQNNKGNILNEIVQDFTPLIKKYTFLLKHEDAQADLQLDFIELICNFKTDSFSPKEDKYVLAYIEKSIRNAYIRRSKEKVRQNHCDFFEDLTHTQKHVAEKTAATYDRYDELDAAQLKQLLTPCQFKVVYYLYFTDLSVKETGQALGISRQSVNKTKSKALATLRQAWL